MDQPKLQLKSKQIQSLKQTQRLMMSNKMQQALQFLQLPALEMTQAIEAEMEQNPVLELIEETHDESTVEQEQELPSEQELEFDDRDLEIFKRLDDDFRDLFSESGDFYKKRTQEEEKRQSYLDQSIRQESTLYEALMHEAHEVLDPAEMPFAEVIIGSLNESGFLDDSLESIAEFHKLDRQKLEVVLKKIQELDPPGVGARDLQESLLLQLKRQLKENTLAYLIIDRHYDDLIKNRLPAISKKLSCTSDEVREAIDRHIAHLDIHPGAGHAKVVVQTIRPDVAITLEEGNLKVTVFDDYIPSLRINSKYLKMLQDPELSVEDKEFIKQKVLSAKWMMRTIFQRNDTLEKVAHALTKWQKDFFIHSKGDIQPLTMKTLAEELSLHESTIARTVANKYIETPRGVFPLRFFFSNIYETSQGEELSQNAVKNILLEIIQKEDKKKPLSDESISKLLNKKGVPCARRTVAKLRALLQIGNTRQRKVHV